MRPGQLIYPFAREQVRSIFVRDRVWFVPCCGVDLATYHFPGWGAPEFFGNSQPVHVEYCSGNGAWIAAKAKECPQVNWVAVEKKFDRVRKVWSKIHNLGLQNLCVVYGEALQVTATYFPDASVSGVYINFPDPWPKRHHAKYRLVVPPFIEQLSRSLKAGATATLVTDDADYSAAMIRDFGAHAAFASRLPSPYYAGERADYGRSYFEELWRGKGCEIRYHEFERVTS